MYIYSLKIKLLFVAVFIIILSALFVCTVFADDDGALNAAAVVTVVKQEPPVTILADYDGSDCLVGCDIGFFKSNNKYYLFLPSSANITSVKLRYDGERKLYDEDTDKYYVNGETTTRNFSDVLLDSYISSHICEYDETSGEYLRYDFIVKQASDCASIYITLDDGDDALKRINSWQGDVETGSLLMVKKNGERLYDGVLTRMKGHGLTSYVNSGKLNTKNSYNINLEDKAELIDGAGKSRKWTMLRIRTNDNYDATGMSYITAFYTFDALVKNDYYNITARFTDVYINGEYRGVYILTERMDINGSINVTDLEDETVCDDPSVKMVRDKTKNDPAINAGIKSYSYAAGAYTADNVDISGGYVLEIMCSTYGEYGFLTDRGMYVNVKSPAYPSKEQVCYISEYVQQFENAIFSNTGYNASGRHFSEYIDEKSFAAQTLVYAFYLNWEIYRTSTYMYKDVDGSEHSLLSFGPVWDFESGPNVMGDETLFGTIFSYDVRQQYLWFEQMWRKGDYLHLVDSVNNHMESVVAQLLGHADGNEIFGLDEMIASVKASQEMNWIRWKQPDSYDSRAAGMVNGLNKRYERWFDTIWNADKYLTGLTASAVENADGSVSMTAEVYGKNNADVLWYKIGDGYTDGQNVGEGAVFTVSKSGLYYCTVSGPNNAYYKYASGDVFSNATLTLTSNIIDSKNIAVAETETAETAPQTTAQTTVEITATLPVTETAPEEESEVRSVAVKSNDMQIIFLTAAVVLISAAAAAVAALIRKGGKK